jgi:hypothetical protein
MRRATKWGGNIYYSNSLLYFIQYILVCLATKYLVRYVFPFSEDSRQSALRTSTNASKYFLDTHYYLRNLKSRYLHSNPKRHAMPKRFCSIYPIHQILYKYSPPQTHHQIIIQLKATTANAISMALRPATSNIPAALAALPQHGRL